MEYGAGIFIFVAGTRPISYRVSRWVGRSVGRSVGPSHFAFFAFLGTLRVGKFVFEHAPAQILTAPAQIITAPAQLPATGAVVYTALFNFDVFFHIGSAAGGRSSSEFGKMEEEDRKAKDI